LVLFLGATEEDTRMTKENSVLFALEELGRLEQDRIAQEHEAAEEALRVEERARAEAEAAVAQAEAHRQAVAAEEARLNVERQLAVRDAEAERRMETLKAELAAVVADRERMHRSIASLADEGVRANREAQGSWGWKVAFASTGLVAVGLGLIVAMREPVPPQIVEVPVEVPVERALEVEAPAADSTADSTPEVPPTPAPTVAVASPSPETRAATRPRGPRAGMRPHTRNMEADPLGHLDCAEDDPTCGLFDGP
jgi:hypothetical protein